MSASDRTLDGLLRELFEEQQAHQQTQRVLTDEIRRLEAENALVAESYKAAHDEVIRLRRSGADD